MSSYIDETRADLNEALSLATNDEVKHFDELARQIRKNRKILNQNFADAKRRMEGKYRWEAYVEAWNDQNHVGGGTFVNDPNGDPDTYPVPKDGDPWPWISTEDKTYKVDGSKSFRQEQYHAVSARGIRDDAEKAAGDLYKLTSDDLDDLESLPINIKEILVPVREAQEFFRNADGETHTTADRMNNNRHKWNGDATEAYHDALNSQRDHFGKRFDELVAIDRSCSRIIQAVAGVITALSEIYDAKIEQWNDDFDMILNAWSNAKDWKWYIKQIHGSVTKHMSDHSEGFQEKVTALGELVEDEQVMAQVEAIKEVEWEPPNNQSFKGM